MVSGSRYSLQVDRVDRVQLDRAKVNNNMIKRIKMINGIWFRIQFTSRQSR